MVRLILLARRAECYSIPYPFFASFFFLTAIFSNCLKCNKKQEKYRVSREKIVNCILNKWTKNLNFNHFLQFTVEKPTGVFFA